MLNKFEMTVLEEYRQLKDIAGKTRGRASWWDMTSEERKEVFPPCKAFEAQHCIYIQYTGKPYFLGKLTKNLSLSILISLKKIVHTGTAFPKHQRYLMLSLIMRRQACLSWDRRSLGPMSTLFSSIQQRSLEPLMQPLVEIMPAIVRTGSILEASYISSSVLLKPAACIACNSVIKPTTAAAARTQCRSASDYDRHKFTFLAQLVQAGLKRG